MSVRSSASTTRRGYPARAAVAALAGLAGAAATVWNLRRAGRPA